MRRLGVFLFSVVAVLVCANGADFAFASSYELLVAGGVVVLSELPDYAIPDTDEPQSSSGAAVVGVVSVPFASDAKESQLEAWFAAVICFGGFVAVLGAMAIAWRRQDKQLASRTAAHASILEAELTASQCETQWHAAQCESLTQDVATRKTQVDIASRRAEELLCLYDTALSQLHDSEARCTSLEQELGESRKHCETTQRAAEESRRASESEIELMREAEMRRAKSGTPPQKVWRTLDDIAFETSSLALAASMAAARAGTHGRNFTDVARTAQSLARRTAHAAQNAVASS